MEKIEGKVLLVDDELTMLQMVADLLRQEGHEVFPFTNGHRWRDKDIDSKFIQKVAKKRILAESRSPLFFN